MCHSRIAFSNIDSLDYTRLVVIFWALESMGSQRISNVVVAGEFAELFGAVERSQAWPSFLHQIDLGNDIIEGCQLLVVASEANRRTNFIAQSVTKQDLMRSYVQNGHSLWLIELFVDESRNL
ncbi:LOW QUALITY PROTEIN: hypothetical protein YC2023_039707 [Brassica napus]